MDTDWTHIFQEKAAEYAQGDNWTLRFNKRIVPDRPNSGWEQYIRNTFGRFRCSRCNRTWPSNLVKVVFHMRLNNRTHQGTIKVRRMRQNCKKCISAPMETPVIDSENLDILMESLLKNIRKKFYNEDFGPVSRRHVGVDVKSPHEPVTVRAAWLEFVIWM
uniref:3CxxC-type domain-containing protein n=1 Tax=Neogobius melanostomus TaxID=47308 RepID=A0A8C6SAV7_9GOBI